jgi:Ulp1 family protease
VIVIDSLGVKRIRPTRVLRNYVCQELATKHQIEVDPDSPAYFDSIPEAKTPFQPNHCDCGVYLIQAIETIVNNPEKFRDYLLVYYLLI